MTKEEIRSRIIEMASNSTGIIVSIPESMAMVGGDMYALRMVDTAKERLPKKENPMRWTSVFGKEILAFTYGNSKRLLEDSYYMEKFLEMAVQFCTVGDVCIFY